MNTSVQVFVHEESIFSTCVDLRSVDLRHSKDTRIYKPCGCVLDVLVHHALLVHPNASRSVCWRMMSPLPPSAPHSSQSQERLRPCPGPLWTCPCPTSPARGRPRPASASYVRGRDHTRSACRSWAAFRLARNTRTLLSLCWRAMDGLCPPRRSPGTPSACPGARGRFCPCAGRATDMTVRRAR